MTGRPSLVAVTPAVALEQGHGTGTVTTAAVAPQRAATRHRDLLSPWPRLLSIDQAGAYLGVSGWVVREWIHDGSLPVVEARRPRTPSALKHRPASETLRRVLLDRQDLDALADSFTRVRR